MKAKLLYENCIKNRRVSLSTKYANVTRKERTKKVRKKKDSNIKARNGNTTEK